jgi:predicted amidohydrolase YtcJ
MGSAYALHAERNTGSIELGKLADIAALDRDLFALDGAGIGDARVTVTLVEGTAVHDALGALS